jgi:hypothetical protein
VLGLELPAGLALVPQRGDREACRLGCGVAEEAGPGSGRLAALDDRVGDAAEGEGKDELETVDEGLGGVVDAVGELVGEDGLSLCVTQSRAAGRRVSPGRVRSAQLVACSTMFSRGGWAGGSVTSACRYATRPPCAWAVSSQARTASVGDSPCSSRSRRSPRELIAGIPGAVPPRGR